MRVFAHAAAALAFLIASCDRPPGRVEVTVEDAWIRLPAAAGRPGAAYFTLRTNSLPMKLKSLSSPQVERIELHETSHQGGVMRMTPVAGVDVPNDGALAFAPGGKHAMLFGIDPALKPGDRLSITFTLQPRMQITADAEVRGPGGAAAGGQATH